MIRLVIGGAGSGKTAYVMKELARRAANGERQLSLVVPEQYSHAAERQLLQIVGDGLSLHGEVLSFRQLASRVSEELGDTGRTLDPGGALLTLYRALQSVSSSLVLYGGSSRRAQFIDALLQTVTELRNSAVTADMLLSAAKDGGALSDKLRDLALIMEAFDAHLKENGEYDAGSALLRLSERIGGSAYASAAFWFDGFNDFTAPEMRVLEALMRLGAELTFCLTTPALEDGGEAFRLPVDTANSLVMLAAECGEKCEIVYPEESSARSPELMRVQDALFGEASDGGGNCGEAVSLLCASDSASECATAASLVLRLVRGGLRYSDIAVMYHGDGSYARLCESVFQSFGIPVFRSGRDDILEKPPIKLITSALDIISSRWEYEDVFSYLKTGLSGLPQDELDRLESFVIVHNIRGSLWSREKPWSGAPGDIDAIRREVSRPLAALSQEMRSARTGGARLRALYAFLEDIGLPETLTQRAGELRLAGQARLADEYLQLWDIIVDALDQMHLVTEDAPLPLPEFSHLLTLLLSHRDVGVIPVALDRVTVGDMSMSRRRNVRALIVLGANEGNMPCLPEQLGVLSGAERGALARLLGQSSLDSPERQVFREYNVIYSALTMPSEQLFLIYSDAPGVQPSLFVDRLAEAFGLVTARLPQTDLIPPGERTAARRASELVPHDRGALSPSAAAALYGDKTRLSATRVEKFASCRFAFFMQNGLRASEREPVVFDAPEAGIFTHFVLERTAGAIKSSGGFSSVSDEEARSLARRFTAEFTAEHYPDFEERSERFRYLLRRLSLDTERIVLDLKHELSRSDFAPMSFETRFGAQIPGAELEVTGVIDRIDGWVRGDTLYLRVADYKTGRKAFSLSDVLYGLGMQMLIYLYALEQSGENALPAGALYTPARDELYSAEKNEPDEKIAAELAKRLRRSGLLLADPEVIDAMETGNDKQYLPVRVTGGGYSGESLVTLSQFGWLLRHVGRTLEQIASELRKGSIDADPYYKNDNEYSCRFCKFSPACGFGSLDGDEYRRLRTLRGAQFWDAVSEGGAV